MHTFLDKIDSLTPATRRIICDKSTEAPYSGLYNDVVTMGSYLCRRCGLALFRGSSQFSAGCGWPSFDDNIAGALKQVPDSDGSRVEIICSRGDGHLGHVFMGEGMTTKNCRYCVNSLAIDFVNDNTVVDSEEAIVAGGCFWGIDYYLSRIPGVLNVEVGYIGGELPCPTYDKVCRGDTGYYEAARVVFDAKKTDYATVLKRFFEIHDPTQRTGQGPDLGSQYKSAAFYYNEAQHDMLRLLVRALRDKGYEVVTRLEMIQPFWSAEESHQHYYKKHNKIPYCHQSVTRFE